MKKFLFSIAILTTIFALASDPLFWDFSKGLQSWEVRNASNLVIGQEGLEFIADEKLYSAVGLTPHGYDYTQVDELIKMHYLADPDTFFILYFDISGGGDLQWWCDAHPEALCRPEDGSELMHIYGGGRGKCASMSSKLWQSTIEEVIRNLVRHHPPHRRGNSEGHPDRRDLAKGHTRNSTGHGFRRKPNLHHGIILTTKGRQL